MKTEPEPIPATAPATGVLSLLDGLLLILAITGGGMLIMMAAGPYKDLLFAWGVVSILLALVSHFSVSLVIETRQQLHAARLEAQAAAAALQRHGECLDWIVQRLGEK